VREYSRSDFRKKRNLVIAVGLLVAVAGGITGLILAHPGNNNDFQPITNDDPIFSSTVFPVSWTKNEDGA